MISNVTNNYQVSDVRCWLHTKHSLNVLHKYVCGWIPKLHRHCIGYYTVILKLSPLCCASYMAFSIVQSAQQHQLNVLSSETSGDYGI